MAVTFDIALWAELLTPHTLFVLLVIHCLVLPHPQCCLDEKKIKICIVLLWLQCFPTVQQLHIVKSSNKQWAAIRVIQYFCFCLTQSRSAAACTRLLGYLCWPGDSEGRAWGSGRWAAPWSPTLATGHNNNHYLSGASGKSCLGPAHNTLFSAGNH